MNYATFTLEGYKAFLAEKVEHLSSMNARNDEWKSDWSKWKCLDRFDDAVDGVISFIILGTSASEHWETFNDLKWEYREKLYALLK